MIPVALVVRDTSEIPKEKQSIPKGAYWYENLHALPWKVVGEKALVAMAMSARWRPPSKHVPVYLDDEVEKLVYNVLFDEALGRWV
ncbi:hypothetical protein HanPI659440_Chr13g0498021 [Helianthus annuus]|nr:hypothetical protein HanPI659440_Chr13g0498021 [Helianthus annuus]